MNWTVLGIGFAGGAAAALVACAFWWRHNKKRLAKVLAFFDVQARVDELLTKTDLDEKVLEKIKTIRKKIDEII